MPPLYSDYCIKGIPNNVFITERGYVAAELFYFHKDSGENRTDNKLEQSINWQDDEDAINFTLTQTKDDGSIHFKEGVVLVPRSELDRITTFKSISGALNYERCPTPSNKYHGNLVITNKVDKKTMKMIASYIALELGDVIRSTS